MEMETGPSKRVAPLTVKSPPAKIDLLVDIPPIAVRAPVPVPVASAVFAAASCPKDVTWPDKTVAFTTFKAESVAVLATEIPP